MRPSEVLDHQASLIDRVVNPAYVRFLEYFTKDMERKGKIKMDDPGGAETLARQIQASLKVAYAYHVQADMMPVIRTAAMDLGEDATLEHHVLPSESGFVIFDEPWISVDVWGKTVATSAVSWAHGSGRVDLGPNKAFSAAGIWIRTYADIHELRDDTTRRLREGSGEAEFAQRLGRWHLNHMWFLPYGAQIGPMENPTPEEYKAFADEGFTAADSVPNDGRFIVAYMRLLGQVIVSVKDEPLDRASRRRAERAKIPARVQVVSLRRRETKYLHESDHQPGSVDWQHSWWVRGHWAWRHCGADHPLAEEYEKGYRAYMYIAPYLKGPDDKPVLITEKVFDLAR